MRSEGRFAPRAGPRAGEEMTSLSTIEKACREGYLVFKSNRQRIMRATASFHDIAAAKNNVWIHLWRTGLWDEVPLSAITVTNELIKGENDMPPEIGSGKRSGKRGGAGCILKTEFARDDYRETLQGESKHEDTDQLHCRLGLHDGNNQHGVRQRRADKGKGIPTIVKQIRISSGENGSLPMINVHVSLSLLRFAVRSRRALCLSDLLSLVGSQDKGPADHPRFKPESLNALDDCVLSDAELGGKFRSRDHRAP